MPFQVTYSQRLVQVNAIQAVDAGKDGNAVCDISFSLTATVIGDLNGHTIVWEQISGLPVTFTTPLAQLSISYDQTTFDDKTFRFYVDKGSARERFDDVTVFGSPTTVNVGTASSPSKYFALNSTPETNGEQLDLKLLTPWPESPHGGVYVKGTYTSAILLWNPPNTDYNIIGYTVKERNNATGLWNDIAVLPSTDRIFTGITFGNSYSVCAIYRFPNSHVGEICSNMVWASGNIADGLIAVDITIPTFAASANSILNFTVQTLSISNKPEIDSHYNGFSVSSHTLSDFSVDQLSITMKSMPDDSVVGGIPSLSVSEINSFDVTVLIGSQVGGS